MTLLTEIPNNKNQLPDKFEYDSTSLQWPPWEQKKVAIVRGGRCSEVSNKSQCNDFLSTGAKKSARCREVAASRGSTVLFKKAGTFYTIYSFHIFLQTQCKFIMIKQTL